MKRRIMILDTTLREGEQAPGYAMLPDEKVAVAELLEKLNVDVIEAGFAAASPGEVVALQKIVQKVRKPVISSFCRARQEDIDAAVMALKKARRARVHVTLGVSDIHLKYKLNLSRSQAMDCAAASIRYAKKYCSDVQFTAEDAGRSDRAFLLKMINRAVKAGASTINLADTVGYLMPEEFSGLIKYLKDNAVGLDRAVLSVHVHDDLGLALASTLSALKAGADQAECTINGIGDRAGICALEEIVRALRARQDCFCSLYTDINEEFILPLSRLVAQYTWKSHMGLYKK